MKVESEIELILEICNAFPALIRLWGALSIDRGRSTQSLNEKYPLKSPLTLPGSLNLAQNT